MLCGPTAGGILLYSCTGVGRPQQLLCKCCITPAQLAAEKAACLGLHLARA